MHSPDIGERTTGIANGKGSIGASSEKEQSRVTLLRVGQLLGFRIDVEEYAVGMCLHVIADFDSLVRVYVIVPDQTQLFQGLATPVALIHGENQSSPIAESRVAHHVADTTCASKNLLRFYSFCSFHFFRTGT